MVTATINERAGNDLILQNALIGINIFEKEVECGNALCQATLYHRPLSRRDNTRQQIIWPDTLCPFLISVYSESDALVKECQVGGLLLLEAPPRRSFLTC